VTVSLIVLQIYCKTVAAIVVTIQLHDSAVSVSCTVSKFYVRKKFALSVSSSCLFTDVSNRSKTRLTSYRASACASTQSRAILFYHFRPSVRPSVQCRCCV